MLYFDIGANIGSWALANVNQCDKIISVEASPITYDHLTHYCRNPKIWLLNYAVCNHPEEFITFYHARASVFAIS